jgi:hypothetical protein
VNALNDPECRAYLRELALAGDACPNFPALQIGVLALLDQLDFTEDRAAELMQWASRVCHLWNEAQQEEEEIRKMAMRAKKRLPANKAYLKFMEFVDESASLILQAEQRQQ